MRFPPPRRLALVVVLALLAGWGVNRLLRDRIFGASAPPPDALGAALADLGDGLEVVATGLEAPWEMAFLPGDTLLVSERGGRLLRIGPEGERLASIVVRGVRALGEGGLMGLALHPDYPDPPRIYVMLTADGPSGPENRIESYRLEGDALTGRAVILDGIPGGNFHDGGRLAFGPDGFLYATTGDAGERAAAQDRGSLAGKILRLTAEGDPAPGNPFGTAVYSWGHRNPQGLAWDDAGRLWSTEHGRSGITSGMDEVNRVEAGTNYGWPVIEGDATAEGMRTPAAHSGPAVTWAPAGAAVLDGVLFFGGLRGQALYQAPIVDGALGPVRAHFFEELGRIRVVKAGPDGRLWLATSNHDGRASPRPGDDRILRLDPAALR